MIYFYDEYDMVGNLRYWEYGGIVVEYKYNEDYTKMYKRQIRLGIDITYREYDLKEDYSVISPEYRTSSYTISKEEYDSI